MSLVGVVFTFQVGSCATLKVFVIFDTPSSITFVNNKNMGSLQMITKLSTRQPNLESKVKALKEIAAENGIALHLEDDPSGTSEVRCVRENMLSHTKAQRKIRLLSS